MRRHDKKIAVQKANLIAEQRYLEEKAALREFAGGQGMSQDFQVPVGIQRLIDSANRHIKFAIEHDIMGGGYFGNTHWYSFEVTTPIVVKGKFVYVEYIDRSGAKPRVTKERYNLTKRDPYDHHGLYELKSELQTIIKGIQRGAKDDGKEVAVGESQGDPGHWGGEPIDKIKKENPNIPNFKDDEIVDVKQGYGVVSLPWRNIKHQQSQRREMGSVVLKDGRIVKFFANDDPRQEKYPNGIFTDNQNTIPKYSTSFPEQ